MVLSGEQGLEVEVELPESEIHRIDTGDGVRVDLPLAGKKGLEGTVHSVGRSASRAGRVFPVVVRLEPAQGVVSGMAAEVVFRTEHEPALSVPVASVINPGGQHPAVFRVKDDVAERVKVEVHELKDERVTLEGPLEPGDRVVVGGHGALVDGERVKPRTARKEKAKDDEGESGAEES
jgi:multidrug efflux pump subunit AcrA (membrane-fusion protein)